ncbi:MAG: MFS transporter, partial [Paludibacteraceae bacterium]|nr:MFS transporter [Paludibacteraceae bacterium]
SVKWSFYVGAAILILCVLYTFFAVEEMDPKEYAEFHNLNGKKEEESASGSAENTTRIWMAFLTVGLVQFFCWAAFMYMWTYSNGAIAINCFGWEQTLGADGEMVWNTSLQAFQDAGNWVGIAFAVQAVGSLLWALILPWLEEKCGNKGAYAISLFVGGLGFISTFFVTNQYVMLLSFFLVGSAWAAMLALPFTIITNAIEGSKYMGTLLGLFNCTICLPQIIAALCGGSILRLCCSDSQPGMLVVAGVLLICGAASVFLIQEKK